MIASLGWGTFLIWGIFNLVIAVSSFFILQETKGKSLEEISAGAYGTESLLEAKNAHMFPSVSSGNDLGSKDQGRVRAHAV